MLRFVHIRRLSSQLPPMITERYQGEMTKQNYKIVGSHSAVKTCRWMLNSLRGRGGCYKHSFYGISSHQCMEATPAVACANRCTFCWRSDSHPVSMKWKFYVDSPEEILNGMLNAHSSLVKQLKGADVDPVAFKEASGPPKHAALSLVGEPVWYPNINELVDMLHKKRISTFLVTNGQFPDSLRDLKPITQLYLSIDAADRDTLKSIDRPLFADYWERLNECLTILRERSSTQRTVCRLTLLKGKNMTNVAGYAELIKKASPGFVEVKGATYAAWNYEKTGLTMDNTPWYEEVLLFAKQLRDELPGYEIACVHEHSVSVLIARKEQYQKQGKWHTWIHFEKFADHPGLTPEEFQILTPSWSLVDSDSKGFNPNHKRHRPDRPVPDEIRKL